MSNINYLVPAKIDLSWLQAELSLYSGLLNVVHAENTKVKREVNGYVALIAKYEREVKELKSAISTKSASLDAQEAKLVSNESENDLILLQLHQVQEDLERSLNQTIEKEQLIAQHKILELKHTELVTSLTEKIQKLESDVKNKSQEQIALAKQHEDQNKSSLKAIAELNAENTKIKHATNGYVELLAKYELEIKELKSAISTKNAALEANEAKLVSNESENDLILLQLHQVQEDLERSLNQITEQEKSIAQYQSLELKHTELVTSLTNQIQKLDRDVKNKSQEQIALAKQHEDQNKSSLKAIAELNAENTKIKHANHGYVELLAKHELEVKELKSAISTKNAALEANEAKLVSTESENDLILLQLHQVQEAFESYLINNISNEKFEQQKELTKLTQEKLNSANEKYRKVTAQVQVLKDRLSIEKNSLCYKMGHYCENEVNGFWKKFTLGFKIGKMRKTWTLESNKVNT